MTPNNQPDIEDEEACDDSLPRQSGLERHLIIMGAVGGGGGVESMEGSNSVVRKRRRISEECRAQF